MIKYKRYYNGIKNRYNIVMLFICIKNKKEIKIIIEDICPQWDKMSQKEPSPVGHLKGEHKLTEKEKVQRGLEYNPNYDQELIKEREIAKDICYEYNQTKPSDIEIRNKIIKKLLGKTKENFLIEQTFWCDYGYNIEIGENFYANHNLVILDGAKVTFGDNVFIGPNCGFYTPNHPIEPEKRNEGIEYAKPIKIGNNVWIGGNVTVLPGVTIGDNVTIGAGSVVTKDIPSNVIAHGVPCKIMQQLGEA